MKRSCKLALCYLLYGVLSLAPAAVAIGLDWEVYTATPQRCFSLSVAGMAALGIVAINALGHTPKNVKRVVWYGLAAAFLWALKPIVASLAVLLTALTGGELVAMLVARPLINKCQRAGKQEDLAQAIGRGLAEAADKGRV